MLILTDQMEQMGRSCAEAFVDRVTAFVQGELGGRAGQVSRDEVVALLQRARGYGFTLQSTLATFVIAARLLGDGFDERLPAAREILLDDRPEELRAFELERLAVSLLAPPLPDEALP